MSEALWAAVDRLTRPRTVKVERAEDADWIAELDDEMFGRSCSVPAYRAATTRTGTLPSLWDQSTQALFGSEVGGGSGTKPLRERSPADLDLMEIRSIIRDTTRQELEKRGTRTPLGPDGEPAQFNPAEIRTLARLVTKSTDELWWWEYRFAAWGRLLETYLHSTEHQPKPTRLRNTACPLCKTRQVRIEQDGEAVVVPALVVEFRDGYVRAARCDACSATWFRGAELHQLADTVNPARHADTA